MRKLIVPILICIIPGCSKKQQTRYIFPSVLIHYVDAGYNDLFDRTANGYLYDSIRAYGLHDGIKTQLSSPSNTNPYGFEPNPMYPRSGIRIGDLNEYKVDRYTVTIIHLKLGVDDTLKMHFTDDLPTANSHSDQAWYNGVPISDTITIVKLK